MTNKASNTVEFAPGKFEKHCCDCAKQNSKACWYCSPPRNSFEWSPIVMTDNIAQLSGSDGTGLLIKEPSDDQ